MQTLADLTERIERSKAASAYLDYVRGRLLRQPIDLLPNTDPHRRIKAAVTDSDALRHASAEYVRLLESQTLLGKLDPMAVPPFVPIVDASDDAIGAFVAQAEPIPMARLALTTTLSDISKLAALITIDLRTAQSADPRAKTMLERVMSNALRRLEDTELLSDTAAVPGVRPAGLLAAAPALGSGTSLEDDIEKLFAFVSDGAPRRPVFVTSPRVAIWLATSDAALFRNARVDGTGDIGGTPLLISPPAANRIVLIDAGRLVVVDDGLEVASSDAAAIAMDDAPSMPANLVSAFQTNSRVLRLVRYLWWDTTTEDTVAYTEIASLGGSPS